MEMATFVAQSPDAPKVRQHIAAALLAIGMMGRSLNEPGVGRPATADFRVPSAYAHSSFVQRRNPSAD